MLENVDFSGVVYAHQLDAPIGPRIEDLEIISKTLEIGELRNRIEYIPY